MRYILFLFLISIPYFSKAQVDTIQIYTDRPGFSDYPKTIPKEYFQIEAGFSFESETVNPNDKNQVINWNNTLIKYGLLSGLELRLSQSFQSQRLLESGTSPQFSWLGNSGPIVVGSKVNLLEGSGLIPQTSILAEYGINTSGSNAFDNNSFYRIQLSSIYQLNPQWYLMANLGYDEFFNNFGRLRFTLNTGYSINEKISVYAEIYGFRSEFLTPSNYFDGGITYLLNPKFQLDIHAGFDLVQQVNNVENYQQSFISMGFGYLFKIQK